MQETAEYRACTYMGDPAGIDGCDDNDAQNVVTKNRQNNVYGHGEVRASNLFLQQQKNTMILIHLCKSLSKPIQLMITPILT